MKVITLKQPWATLVAEGLKKYEFRSWKCSYRGELLIHAGAGVDKEAMQSVAHLNYTFPKKRIIAEVNLTDCILLDEEKSKAINKTCPLVYRDKIRTGYAFKLEDVEKINIDVEIPGKLGFWEYNIKEC